MLSSGKATLVGLGAIVLWGAMVGLVRIVAENFGATLGAALIYTLASVFLWVTRRPRDLRSFSPSYLLVCGVLFVLYEVCFGLSLGLAADAGQAIEVSIVNYLWPTLTVLLSVIVARPPRLGWTFVPGVLLAVLGVVWVIGGDAGLDGARLMANVSGNPLPYALALTGALAWAFYSVYTPRLAGGRDALALFFSATAVALWVVHATMGIRPPGGLGVDGVVALLVVAVVIAGGYICWNIGILGGNLTLLASASYATPVLSAAMASLLLGASLSWSFWQGVAFVAAGSLLGWWGTRDRPSRKNPRSGTS